MILNEDQKKSLEEAAKPLMKWLCENCHPHVTVVCDGVRFELSEGVMAYKTEEFVVD